MVSLNSAPAFGFETSSSNAEGFYKNMFEIRQKKVFEKQNEIIAKLNNPKLANMTDIQSDPDYQKFMNEKNTEAAKTAWKTANVVKILGYIPLIGTFIGITRILSAAKATKQELPNKVNHITRGTIELFSLGFLLAIPDLILTGFRART